MKEPIKEIKVMTRGAAIRAKCLDCCCFQQNEVTKCIAYDCPLWPYRMSSHAKSMKYLPDDIKVVSVRPSPHDKGEKTHQEGEA